MGTSFQGTVQMQSARIIMEILFLSDVAERTNDTQILPSNKFD